jgi:hypothetical protein
MSVKNTIRSQKKAVGSGNMYRIAENGLRSAMLPGDRLLFPATGRLPVQAP